ncbi:MAG: hypothetical protein ACC652_00275 [Acidimicrobiales bacterium]
MRRSVVFAAAAVTTALAIKLIVPRVVPTLQARCSDMCDRMLDSMPDSFPPKRVMTDLESIKDQTSRILDELQRRPELSDRADSSLDVTDAALNEAIPQRTQ